MQIQTCQWIVSIRNEREKVRSFSCLQKAMRNPGDAGRIFASSENGQIAGSVYRQKGTSPGTQIRGAVTANDCANWRRKVRREDVLRPSCPGTRRSPHTREWSAHCLTWQFDVFLSQYPKSTPKHSGAIPGSLFCFRVNIITIHPNGQ
jgi:hypothetical protein